MRSRKICDLRAKTVFSFPCSQRLISTSIGREVSLSNEFRALVKCRPLTRPATTSRCRVQRALISKFSFPYTVRPSDYSYRRERNKIIRMTILQLGWSNCIIFPTKPHTKYPDTETFLYIAICSFIQTIRKSPIQTWVMEEIGNDQAWNISSRGAGARTSNKKFPHEYIAFSLFDKSVKNKIYSPFIQEGIDRLRLIPSFQNQCGNKKTRT